MIKRTVIFLGLVFLIITIIGCAQEGQKEIKIGATFPLTGEVASYGQKAQRGIQLATEELNAEGGLLNRNVVIDFQDDKNDKKEAVSIFTKFATVDKLPVVFGSAGSGCSLAIVPLANRYKVLLVSPISSSEELSSKGGEYFFRTVPSDDLQSQILSKWVFDSGAKRIAIVYTNNSWGKSLADGFTANFQKLGGTILDTEGTNENSNDFRSIISKLKKIKNLDAIISPTYPKEGGVFVRQSKELGFKIKLFGGDNWGAPEFLNIAKDAAEGVLYTAPTKSSGQTFDKFASKYKGKYNEDPDVFSAYAYDAAKAVFLAIKNVNSLEPNKIRDALLQIVYLGASGEISFRSNGDLKSESFAKKTIKNGKAIDIK